MPNRLATETSPYLRQHADNPVEWYPWSEEALTLSRETGRPILLSIGYSACHWCHVMAHESFEDQDIAAVMNRLYVSIKVDREERPDLDQIYQTAHHMLTQRAGGWPLTMFLMPDGTPFFGGTYFPKSARYGLPGFRDLLEHVAAVYVTRRTELDRQSQSLIAALASTLPARSTHRSEFSEGPLRAAVEVLSANYDRRFGGFGGAPKFPHPTDLAFLLRRYAATGNEHERDMVLTTLERMAQGGIYDQLGGGFSRYSVDESWNIPHFEKMLYDNGPLLRLYSDAWVISRNPLFRTIAEETAGWVMREMQAPEGGYYSSLDADSEHEEGRFYVWTLEQVAQILTHDEYLVAARHLGLSRPANFERTHWHLFVAEPLADTARALCRPLGECEQLLTSARRKLLSARETRVRPGRDEKVLTSWNALMVEGMAHAALVFGRKDWLESARRALRHIRTTLWRDGRLLATCKDGQAHLKAYLDDYAFVLGALIELIQVEFHVEDLEFAEELAEVLLEQFEDRNEGGFFFTGHEHERLIHRSKPGHDNATPGGNGMAALCLRRLANLTGETRYQDAAERTLQLFYAQLAAHPSAMTTIAMLLEETLVPPRTVILRGPDNDTSVWRSKLAGLFMPYSIVLPIGTARAGLPPVLDKPMGNAVNAWVCSGVTCLALVSDWAELEAICRESISA